MRYTCLIVDDESPAHQVILSHASQLKNLEIIASAYNGKEALDIIRKYKVDILFLDVEMPQLNGMELIECLPYKPAIILISAYSNFGFEAFQNDVIDYLLKPVSFPCFLKAINKAIKQISQEYQPANLVDLEAKHEGKIKRINIEKLLYFQSKGNYVKLIFEDEKSILIQQSLKYIESILPKIHFVRIHKSYIVKKSNIGSVSKTAVLLKNQNSLPLGRKYSVLLDPNLYF